MKSYLKFLLLLFGIFSITAYSQEDVESPDGEDEPPEGEYGEGEEPMEGEEDGEEPMEDGEESDGQDEDGGMEKMEAISPEHALALHKKIDANGNGKVSLAEIMDYAHKMRRALAKSELDEVMADSDTNKDGKLDWKEFLGDASEISEEDQNEKSKTFKELDTNNDQAIDHNELAQMYHHHISDEVEAKLTDIAMKDKDLDKNGKLTLEEFFQHLHAEGEEKVDIPDEDKEVFKKLDTDGSGDLTLKELKAWESNAFQAEEATRKMFEMMDKDKDNHVTAEEMQAAREEVAEHADYEPQMYLTQWAEQHAGKNEL